MKPCVLVVLFGLLFVANGTETEKRITPRLEANVNQYIDVLLGTVDKWLINQGMDPLQMEDVVKSFSVKPIIITYHAELYLTHGWLQGISAMKRGGDAEMSYEAMFLNLKLPLVFDTLTVDYDYDVEVMGLLKHRGGLDARIANLHLLVDISIDTKRLEIFLQDFRITNAGSIDVKLSGHPLIDWLANTITKMLTTVLHDLVKGKIETEVRAVLENAINEINNRIPHKPQQFWLK